MGRGIVHGEVKGGSEKLEVFNLQPDSGEMGGTFLPQRGNDINAGVQVHIVRGTISKATKMHKLTNSQRILPQMQLKIKRW